MTMPPVAISLALVKAQAAVDCARKDGTNANEGDSYSYATADELVRVGKAAMAAHGLALLPMRYTVIAGEGGADLVRDVSLIHESGQFWTWQVRWPIPPGKARDKALASALTSLLGYTYRDLMGIPRVMFGEEPMDVRRETPAAEPERPSVLAQPRKVPGDRHNNGKRPPYMPVERPKKSAEEQAADLERMRAEAPFGSGSDEITGQAERDSDSVLIQPALTVHSGGVLPSEPSRADGPGETCASPVARACDVSAGVAHPLTSTATFRIKATPGQAEEIVALNPGAVVEVIQRPPSPPYEPLTSTAPVDVQEAGHSPPLPSPVASAGAPISDAEMQRRLDAMPTTEEEVAAFEAEHGPPLPLDQAFVERTTARILERIHQGGPGKTHHDGDDCPTVDTAEADAVVVPGRYLGAALSLAQLRDVWSLGRRTKKRASKVPVLCFACHGEILAKTWQIEVGTDRMHDACLLMAKRNEDPRKPKPAPTSDVNDPLNLEGKHDDEHDDAVAAAADEKADFDSGAGDW